MKKPKSELQHDSEKSYKSLFEQAGDAIFKGNLSGSFLQVNSAASKLTGYSQQELLLMSIEDIFTKTQLEGQPLRYDMLNENKSIIKERNILTKTGNIIPVEMNSKKVDNNSYLSIMRNISYRKKIEKNLKYNEEKFRKLFSEAPDGILLLNEKGIIIDCNQAYCNILKGDKSEIINTHVSSSICENEKRIFIDKYPNLINTGKEEGELCLITKNKEIIYTWRSASALYSEDGKYKGAIVHTHDISKQKQLEEQLSHSQKMQAIGLMASGVAHNFNNILQAIVGYTSFAKEGLKEDSQRFKDIEQINQHVKKAAAHTKELLAVGKEQYLDKNTINLVTIITPIIELLTRSSNNMIQIIFNPKETIPTIRADEKQIDQVIRNIILNAKDAMPKGGSITITTKQTKIDKIFCDKHSWAKQGNYLQLNISDTGHGMDINTLRRIFEPYFTTKEIYKGTGLGLSTTFGIISQHKGMINVISEINIGSTFEIYLPL